MHKFEGYIRDFLLNNGIISLEGIGVLRVIKEKSTAENGPPPGIPAIEFTLDKNAATTTAFIDYTAEKEGRNRGLVQSDIQSFLIETRQMVNIGKPFVIDGVGMIQLSKNWQFEFLQKTSPDAKEEDFTRNRTAEETSFPISTARRPEKNKLGWIVILITLVILGGIAWSLFYYLFDAESNIQVPKNMVTDSAVTAKDTALPQPPTHNSSILVNTKKDSFNYRFILESSTNRALIRREYSELKSRNAEIHTDSLTNGGSKVFRVFLLRRTHPSDTSFIKDSLEIYLGKTVAIEQIK